MVAAIQSGKAGPVTMGGADVLEMVALSALTGFLTAAGNGAAGEMGKQLLQSTGALVRRTMGRETPLPTSPEGWQTLAAQTHARLGDDPGGRVSGRCSSEASPSGRWPWPRPLDCRPRHGTSPTDRRP
ncbi:hypothetical protein NKH77_19110 [Streptomyces sp. M19]